jgi:L-lactate utilization protein LutB
MTKPAEIVCEEGLDRGFVRLVGRYPGAEKLAGCIQCGTCSGSCQLAQDMDYTPRQIIEMTRVGLKDAVLGSKAIWYCASCYSCTVRCPKGIKVTEVMYALRALAIKRGRMGRGNLSPIFYTSFSSVFAVLGRMHEAALILLVAMRSNPFRLFGMMPMGVRMFLQGKLGLLPKRVRGMDEVRRMLARAKELEAAGTEVPR